MERFTFDLDFARVGFKLAAMGMVGLSQPRNSLGVEYEMESAGACSRRDRAGDVCKAETSKKEVKGWQRTLNAV